MSRSALAADRTARTTLAAVTGPYWPRAFGVALALRASYLFFMEIALHRPSLLADFERAMVAEFEAQVAEWQECRKLLRDWEDRNALDNSNLEALAEHKEMLEMMSCYGQLFSLASSHPKFPRNDLAEQVQATLWILRDQYQASHNPISKEKADAILAAVFPDES